MKCNEHRCAFTVAGIPREAAVEARLCRPVRVSPTFLELINRGRHHLHDPEALLLQLSQEARQGANRCGMDVVEQQNAFATRVKAVHCQGDDFFRRDARVPVIRHCVGAEVDE